MALLGMERLLRARMVFIKNITDINGVCVWCRSCLPST